MILARRPHAGAVLGRERGGHKRCPVQMPHRAEDRGLPGQGGGVGVCVCGLQEVKGWGAASGLGSPCGTKQALFHLCPAPRLLSTITQQLPVPEQPQSHRRGEHEAARVEAGRWVGWRDEVCGSSGRDRSRTRQDQAVLGYLMQAAELGLLLSISSAHFTAPVHLEAGLQPPCHVPRVSSSEGWAGGGKKP